MSSKPRQRAEDDYYWPMPLTPGFASSNVGPDEAPDPVAVLWVPDPEQRHGYREYYVRRDDDKPGARPLGFGKGR